MLVIFRTVTICGALAVIAFVGAYRIRFRETTLLHWVVEDLLDLGPLYGYDEEGESG
jgi:hypothetical protein